MTHAVTQTGVEATGITPGMPPVVLPAEEISGGNQEASSAPQGAAKPAREESPPAGVHEPEKKRERTSRTLPPASTGFWKNLFSRYSVLRFLGYMMAFLFSPMARVLGGWKMEWEFKTDSSLDSRIPYKKKSDFYRDKGTASESNVEREFLYETLHEKEHLAVVDRYFEKAKSAIRWIEVFVFTGAALLSFWKDRKELCDNFKIAVGAKLGIAPDKVGLRELKISGLPIAESAYERLAGLYYKVRFLAPLLFGVKIADGWEMVAGMFGQTVAITVERAAAMEETAYHILQNMIDRKFVKGVPRLTAKGEIFDSLEHAFQQSRQESGRDRFSYEEMEKISPLLNRMAELMLTKHIEEVKTAPAPKKAKGWFKEILPSIFGDDSDSRISGLARKRFNEIVYLLGEIDPDNMEKSSRMIEFVYKEGLDKIGHLRSVQMKERIDGIVQGKASGAVRREEKLYDPKGSAAHAAILNAGRRSMKQHAEPEAAGALAVTR